MAAADDATGLRSGRGVSPPHGAGRRLERREIVLHGHRVMYRTAGEGPAVVLVHGMLNSSRHWSAVAERLAEDHRVVVPDLLGHGESAKPEGDYSLGAHASGIRDLLAALGIDRATIVGHSFGGGVAMIFYYQFPERCERLVLVSSGGLGPEVSAGLRVAALPGADPVLAAIASRPGRAALRRAGTLLRRAGVPGGRQLQAAARGLAALEGRGARRGFLFSLRSVIAPGGQRVSARDRLYLAAGIPSLIVWGEEDRLIPPRHAAVAHAAMPASRLVTIPGAGHFPHVETPAAVADAIREFLLTTSPARVDAAGWRSLVGGTAAP